MSIFVPGEGPNCQVLHFDRYDYEAGDQAYILRLKVLLFERVVVEPLDLGHKLICCSACVFSR